jgi:hypothetical protein
LFKEKFVLTKSGSSISNNGADELAGEMSCCNSLSGSCLADFEKKYIKVLLEFEESGVAKMILSKVQSKSGS